MFHCISDCPVQCDYCAWDEQVQVITRGINPGTRVVYHPHDDETNRGGYTGTTGLLYLYGLKRANYKLPVIIGG